MSEHLFVGGPHDGKRMHFETPLPVYQLHALSDDGEIFTTINYRGHRFAADSESWTIYAPDSSTPADIMRQLIEKYPKPERQP